MLLVSTFLASIGSLLAHQPDTHSILDRDRGVNHPLSVVGNARLDRRSNLVPGSTCYKQPSLIADPTWFLDLPATSSQPPV